MSETFTCVKCDRELPIENFQKAKDRKSGHLPACRECMNTYTSMMRTKKRNENIDAARKKEREAHRRYKEKLAKENPQKLEALREKRRAYYQKNRDAILEGYKVIPDDDPEDDLRPITDDASWHVISSPRRASIAAHEDNDGVLFAVIR